MAKVYAVGFDVDDTLFDHLGSARAAVDAFYGSLGIESTEEALSAWFSAEKHHFERWRSGHISFQEQRRERLRHVLPAFGVPVPSKQAQLDELFEQYLQAYQAAWRPFPDAVDLVRGLRASGYRVGILTNGTQEQQLAKLKTIGLAGEVDVVCTSERIGAQKPEPRAFTVLAHELGVTPSQCLFVGDNAEHDVAGALAAGMHALLIDRRGAHAHGITAAVLDTLATR